MRIDKFISKMGIAARKEAAKEAKRGGVRVNGVAVKDLSKHINPEVDKVSYLGREIEYKQFVYVMLNKPEGYVSATEDTRNPYVTELLPEELRRRELFPVGRLDKDTVGLMILTNDGATAHSALSPKHHVDKLYRFKCIEPMRADCEEIFLKGITLGDGYECKSAELIADSDRLGGLIKLTEGKYHQIKRMLGAVGNKIIFLERVSFAGIPLDTELSRGEWRYLTESEEKLLKSHTV